MIGILNLNLGNLKSVANAVYELGFDFSIANDPQDFAEFTHLIVPGVGSYQAAMRAIHQLDLYKPLHAFVDSGRPVLGICLGMQILSDVGEEIALNEGLGLIKGKVIKFSEALNLPIPHVGWNSVAFKVDHPIFFEIKNNVDFYFVHSYHYGCEEPAEILAVTDYGSEFPCIVGKKNIIGVQFHPEKSQNNGLKLIENFCRWNGVW